VVTAVSRLVINSLVYQEEELRFHAVLTEVLKVEIKVQEQ
jgi:hypothetical protein